MAGKKRKDPRTYMLLFLLGAVVVTAWFVAPYFVPVYRHLHVDFQEIAAKYDIPQEALEQPQEMFLRYAPRGEGDPAPWQLISQQADQHTPDWLHRFDPATEEEGYGPMLIRVWVILDGDGEPPSTMRINSGLRRDLYWSGQGWRLPPGALGVGKGKRTVVLMRQNTWSKCDVTTAEVLHGAVRSGLKKPDSPKGYVTDDDPELYPTRDDGYRRPPPPPEEEQ